MAYNTGNPLGSSSPKDLSDNSHNLDLAMGSTEKFFLDRFGRPRLTYQAFHEMAVEAISEVDQTVSAAQGQVNQVRDSGVQSINGTVSEVESAGESAKAEMLETAANLGSDLNNKRYTSYAGDKGMLSDPQTRDAVVGIVDGDPDENLDGWYAWNNITKKWVRFIEQPASSTKLAQLADDPQRPRAKEVQGLMEELLVAITDSEGHGTWLEANKKDGGPSQWAIHLMRLALGALVSGYPGMLFAVSDANGNMTDIAIRDTDGQFDEYVIARMAPRLKPYILAGSPLPFYLPDMRGTTSQIFGSDTYVRDGQVLPVLPHMQRWAGWGSSTIAQFGEMTGLAQQFGAAYYNGGQGSEASTHVAARMGSVPALLTVPAGVIPAAAGSVVAVNCSNIQATQYFRPTIGYLNGVKGQLTSTDTAFSFTRSDAGAATATVGELPFVPVEGPDHRADVTFLNMGKNDLNFSLDSAGTIKRIDASYDWLAPLVKRVIVIGQFKNTGTVAGSTADIALTQVDAASRKRYGRQFFDLGAYLSSPQVWTDTGITPTAQDQAQQALGNLAPSLSSDGLAHMNATTRAAVANKLKALVQSLGWY